MKKIVYILGQARCGSTALSLALGNHPGVLNLGESSRWMWGMIDAKDRAGVVDFSKEPEEDVWIDSSKSVWRLGQWRKTGYDVKVLWLKRPLWQCVRSRIKRDRPDLSLGVVFMWSLMSRLLNWSYLHLCSIPHCDVSYRKLKQNDKKTAKSISGFTGFDFCNLYKEYDANEQRLMTGNPRTIRQGRIKLA